MPGQAWVNLPREEMTEARIKNASELLALLNHLHLMISFGDDLTLRIDCFDPELAVILDRVEEVMGLQEPLLFTDLYASTVIKYLAHFHTLMFPSQHTVDEPRQILAKRSAATGFFIAMKLRNGYQAFADNLNASRDDAIWDTIREATSVCVWWSNARNRAEQNYAVLSSSATNARNPWQSF